MQLSRNKSAPVFLIFIVSFCARAELAVPRLQSIFPIGAKQGSELVVESSGGNLDETAKMYFSHPGITAALIEEVGPPNPNPNPKNQPPKSFKVKVGKDVPVGEYDVRVAGKYGISNPRTFCVGDVAESQEKEPNNTREAATRVNINNIINARIGGGEDVDWYAFAAKKGQRVLVECKAWRIDSRLDGFMWLYNSEGKQLATSQDEDIRDEKRDPFMDVEIPADGEYFVKITDFTYNGSGDYFYRLSISTLPYIDYIVPSSAAPGTTANVTIFGRNLPGGENAGVEIHGRPLQKVTKAIKVPNDPVATTELHFSELVRPWSSSLDGMEVRLKSDAGSSNAKLLMYDLLPQVFEAEPNDDKSHAQRLTVPCSVHGQFLGKDPDFYSFTAKKDEKFTIQIFATRIGSPADPDMEISKADDNVIANPQDTGENIGQLRFTSNNRDIVHLFTAPADGDFFLRLEHLFRQTQSGPQYIYRLEVQKDAKPDFRIVCTPPHEIKMDTHVIYQGGRERFDVLVWRLKGHNEPITIEAKNLPKGLTADPIVIGPDVKWGTFVITAAPDAPAGEAPFEIIGTSTVKDEKLVRSARGGSIVWDTVNTPALSRMNRSMMLSVRETVAFKITTTPAELTVTKGEPINLTVTVKRRDDMPNAVQINGAGFALPKGIEIPVKTIEANQTELKLSISSDKVSDGTFSIIVNGDGQVPVNKNNVRCVYPSNPVKVTILKKKEEEKKK